MYNKNKLGRTIISQIILMAMLLSMVSPFIVEALEAANITKLEQAKWQEILDTDLSDHTTTSGDNIFSEPISKRSREELDEL
ncbi:hypothetical protein FACS1894105_10620 [Clostridia bacterium]|nr:hypothetical protein FACS1894105_10620 [Clostridia bacterium]